MVIPVRAPPLDATSALDTVLAYHARSKHAPDRYAPGPQTLDWDAQPQPFRWFDGAPQLSLPLAAERFTLPFSALQSALSQPHCIPSRSTLGALLELSLGLAAWKRLGPDRWAVRCNPSSGNLHPTEAYVLCQGVQGVDDGLYHYLARDHALEQRCRFAHAPGTQTPLLIVGLTSIHWREAWKYGERGWRYCLLDTGHALGALRYAAGVLGWTTHPLHCSAKALRALTGTDRPEDFAGAEPEDAERAVALGGAVGAEALQALQTRLQTGHWVGRANVLDAHPMYAWPAIAQVATATRMPARAVAGAPREAPWPARNGRCTHAAVALIRGRRSAQRHDRQTPMSREAFFDLLDAMLPRPTHLPWDAIGHARVHLVLYVHRVEGMQPGAYALARSDAGLALMRDAMAPGLDWSTVPACPPHLPLRLLKAGALTSVARRLACHQAIAADGCLSLAMLGEFESRLAHGPWEYRELFVEAGLIGQALYLEAEAAGLQGTGIGCFFDDAVHGLLGLHDQRLQCLYQFSIGAALTDPRIDTSPPYDLAVAARPVSPPLYPEDLP